MDGKTALYRIRNSKPRLKIIEEKIEELKYSLLPTGIRYDHDKVQTTPEDRMLKVFEKIDDRRLGYEFELLEYQRLTELCERIIHDISPKEANALTFFFIDGLSEAAAAKKMGVSERHFRRAKADGMKLFEERWKDES